MHHFFDVELAKKYGVLEALLLDNIDFWITKNEANGAHFHEGRYWTYNSTRAFAELFPYYSARSVHTALRHLVDEGIITTGRFGKASYDRTLWYAFTDFGLSILQKCKMDCANLSNGLRKNVETITDNNPSLKTDKNTNSMPLNQGVCADIIEHLNKMTNKSFRANSRRTIALINARFRDGFTADELKDVIDIKCAEWGQDQKMSVYLRPETLFGTKCESYLNQRKNPGGAEKSFDAAEFFNAAVEKGRKKNDKNH